MSDLLKAIEDTAQAARDACQLTGAASEPVIKPYRWIMVSGIRTPRAECRAHGVRMKWAMKISHDYPQRVSKHDDRVIYNGLLLQVWKCPETGCEVEAVV